MAAEEFIVIIEKVRQRCVGSVWNLRVIDAAAVRNAKNDAHVAGNVLKKTKDILPGFWNTNTYHSMRVIKLLMPLDVSAYCLPSHNSL